MGSADLLYCCVSPLVVTKYKQEEGKILKRVKYDLKNLKGDILGGITTAVVALPLALALGVASGAGAKAGLYSAVFTGILSTIFGGTPAQINGPTAAMTVVLIEVYDKLGVEGLFPAMALAGVLQILMGLFRLGKYIHLIPHSVIIGFTNGIGALIFIKMIPYFQSGPIVALITMAVMFISPYITKKVPASLLGLIAGTACGIFLFKTGAVVGPIPTGFPEFAIPTFALSDSYLIVKTAVILALLGGIESLLASVVVDEMTKTRHHSNRELMGQGIGNTIAALFGSLIGTGAIVRSAVNVNAGGRTRLSGVLHAVIIFLIIMWFGPYASQIPLAVLGGILMVTAIKMIEYETSKELASASNKAGTVIVVTMLFTIFTDLVIAVLAGTLLAMFIFVIRMANVYLKEYPVDSPDSDKKILSYTIEGPLFFGVSHAISSQLEIAGEGADVIILNLMNIPFMDTTGAVALRSVYRQLEDEDIDMYFAGVKDSFLPLMSDLQVASPDKLELGRRPILEIVEHVKQNH